MAPFFPYLVALFHAHISLLTQRLWKAQMVSGFLSLREKGFKPRPLVKTYLCIIYPVIPTPLHNSQKIDLYTVSREPYLKHLPPGG